jgi:hypothetical protein
MRCSTQTLSPGSFTINAVSVPAARIMIILLKWRGVTGYICDWSSTVPWQLCCPCFCPLSFLGCLPGALGFDLANITAPEQPVSAQHNCRDPVQRLQHEWGHEGDPQGGKFTAPLSGGWVIRALALREAVLDIIPSWLCPLTRARVLLSPV